MAPTERFGWLADWKPSKHRDPLTILGEAAEGRDVKLVRQRTDEMSGDGVSVFFRGSAGVMAADLGFDRDKTTQLEVDVCGDAHIGNFGTYGSPERLRVFDLNDFDEARRGPWEWDVCRLVASAVITERDRGSSQADQAETAREAASAYADTAAALAAGPYVNRWYRMTRCDQVRYRDLALRRGAGGAARVRSRARKLVKADPSRTQRQTVDELTSRGRFKQDTARQQEPLDGAEAQAVRATFDEYRSTVAAGLQRVLDGYTPTAVATRPVGAGSLGLRNYLMLVCGNGTSDALILQVKQAEPSQLDRALGPGPTLHQGERVVRIQQAMQGASDPLLGWTTIAGQEYYVRQFRDMKTAPDLADTAECGHRDLVAYARLCGTTLARAHTRTIEGASIGDISRSIGGSDNKRRAFAKAMVTFGEAYADVAADDQKRFRKRNAKRG